jgi:hypothetical protein
MWTVGGSGGVTYHGAGLEGCDVVVEGSEMAGYQRVVRFRRYGVRLKLGVYVLVDW